MAHASSGSDGELLSAREAAARLGVKPETLYAYVSRGFIAPRRVGPRRQSFFAAADLERLLVRGRRRRDAEVPIASALTLIREDGHAYRGRPALQLARRFGFERTAEWLWGAADGPPPVWAAEPTALAAAREAQRALPAAALPLERLPLTAAALAGTARSGRDASAPGARTAGRRLLPALVDALPPASGASPGATPAAQALAARLWTRLSPAPPASWQLPLLDAALVLVADHELAASTLAARVAASAQADPYAVVLAGLGVVQGALHGATSLWIEGLLEDAERRGAERALAERRRFGQPVLGFGHPLYPAGDPRARLLLDLLRRNASRERLSVVETLADAAAAQELGPPNVDFALAAFAHSAGLVRGAAEAIFAIARTAGWLAHAIEEYEHRSGLLRLRAVYVGPEPSP